MWSWCQFFVNWVSSPFDKGSAYCLAIGCDSLSIDFPLVANPFETEVHWLFILCLPIVKLLSLKWLLLPICWHCIFNWKLFWHGTRGRLFCSLLIYCQFVQLLVDYLLLRGHAVVTSFFVVYQYVATVLLIILNCLSIHFQFVVINQRDWMIVLFWGFVSSMFQLAFALSPNALPLMLIEWSLVEHSL